MTNHQQCPDCGYDGAQIAYGPGIIECSRCGVGFENPVHEALRKVREDIDHQAVIVGDALAIIDRHLRGDQ